MAKFKNKISDEQVEAITFDELVEHGKANCDPSNIHNGMPWSFNYKEVPVTHENDHLYLVCQSYPSLRFGINDVLITDSDNKMSISYALEFNNTHEKISD